MGKTQETVDVKGDQDKYSFDLCVLIVEDDEIMRLSLEDRLRLEGIPGFLQVFHF